MSKNGEYAVCPLCGALVRRVEIEKYGCCEVCRRLIEALTGYLILKGGAPLTSLTKGRQGIINHPEKPPISHHQNSPKNCHQGA